MANTVPKGRIVPTSPTMGTPDPLQGYAEAHNALAMALHYLRQPGPANVPGATRKAVQALAALRGMGSAHACMVHASASASTQGGAA